MFDDMFGPKAKAATAVDTYLDRMEKALTIQKLANDLSEVNVGTDMTTMIKALVDYTILEMTKMTKEFREEKAKEAEAKKEQN